MQYFRPGSQLRQLITMLSIVGEYPIRSLYLLGNERAYKALVHKLTTPETFRIPQTETELTTRLLTVTGKGTADLCAFTRVLSPYWIGFTLTLTGITWTPFGNTNSPGMPHIGTETTVLPKLRLCVCAQVLNADHICFLFFKTGPSPSGSPMRPAFTLPKN